MSDGLNEITAAPETFSRDGSGPLVAFKEKSHCRSVQNSSDRLYVMRRLSCPGWEWSLG